MRRSTLATFVGLTVACTGAAAQAQSTSVDDPWERFNRRGFAIHQALDHAIFRHIAELYTILTPGAIGRGLHNMLVNLSEPVVALNDILQGRFHRADVSTVRFAINSTIGLGGIIDVVGKVKPADVHRDNSFSVTLGVWGFKPGPYLFIPLLGPSTVRDLFGGGVDATIDPFHWANYPGRTELTTSRAVVAGIEVRARVGPDLDTLLSGAADPYATLRSVYMQNRQSQIDGTDGTDAAPINDLPNFDDPTASPSPSSGPAPADSPAAQPAPAETAPQPKPVPGPVSAEVIRSSGGRMA